MIGRSSQEAGSNKAVSEGRGVFVLARVGVSKEGSIPWGVEVGSGVCVRVLIRVGEGKLVAPVNTAGVSGEVAFEHDDRKPPANARNIK